jgi:hypothetical protein
VFEKIKKKKILNKKKIIGKNDIRKISLSNLFQFHGIVSSKIN